MVTTDGSAESLDAVYQIFERLNSGGTQLTPHEIRVALYAGEFISMLEVLNQLQSWRALYGTKSPRLRDQELVLRVLALYLDANKYKRPLKSFLNNFVAENRNGDASDLITALDTFGTASNLLLQSTGDKALRRISRQVNAAQTEAIFVGLMNRIARRPINISDVDAAVSKIQKDPAFETAVSRSTADELVVHSRLQIATRAFAHP